MAPNPRRQDEQLQALYDELPAIDCSGYCHDSCGPIELSIRERERIERTAGKPLTCGIGPSCSMLTADRRCSVYEIRPLICRLWGLTHSMRCPYGCLPERFIEDEEAFLLIARADRIGGVQGKREERIAANIEAQMRWLRETEGQRFARALARQMIVRPSVDGRHKLAKSIFEHQPTRGSHGTPDPR